MNKEIHDKYGLRIKKTGELVGYIEVSNQGRDCCGDTSTSLDALDEENRLWFVDAKEHAEFVRQNSTEWYNAGHDTPTHTYKADELEIVCINIEIQAKVVDVKIPTHYQFFKDKYEKVNPNHWNNLKEYFKEGGWNPPQYSLWDLMEKLKDGKT